MPQSPVNPPDEPETPSPLEPLLELLNPDREGAGAIYLDLHAKLVKFFQFKGCPSTVADDLAEDALDRMAKKVAAGEQVENPSAYAYSFARFVWLEWLKKPSSQQLDDNEAYEKPDSSAVPDQQAQLENIELEQLRTKFLNECMDKQPTLDQTILIRYFDAEDVKNSENRKQLALDLGITGKALKTRACRIRAKVKKCIEDCIKKGETK